MFHYSKAAIRVVPRILVYYTFKLRKWAKNVDKYPRELRFNSLKRMCERINKALHVDLHIFGLENIPTDSNYCLICNHMSAYDPVALITTCPGFTTFVGKKELMKVKILNRAIESIECLYMDRDDLRQSLKVMLKVEEDLKKKEKNWLIFPEGTRIRDQLLPVEEFHHGTFRPAYKAGVPIVPVAIYGTFRVFKMKPQFKNYPVCLSFLKPIMPSDFASMNTGEVAKMAHDAIQRELTYHLRPLDHKIMSEGKEKHYRFNDIL